MTQARHTLTRRHFTRSLPGLALGVALPSAFAAGGGGVYQASQQLMGTRVDVSLRGGPIADMALAAQAAFGEMHRLASMMSRFQPRSALNRVNLMAGVAPVVVPEELMHVLRMAERAHSLSGGAFDATVGTYSGWTFGTERKTVPDPAVLLSQRAWVNQSEGLSLDAAAGTAFLVHRGARLDLGGIAKLPILQAGMARLQSLGAEQAMINGGGDVVASARPHDRPWKIGLRDPRRPDQVLGTVDLHSGWVAASGDYERFFVHQGRRWHHVLDPRTGYPSQGAHGVVLMGRDLSLINGLGAAVMVAGAPAGRSIAQHAPGMAALIVGRDNQLWLSPDMARTLRQG